MLKNELLRRSLMLLCFGTALLLLLVQWQTADSMPGRRREAGRQVSNFYPIRYSQNKDKATLKLKSPQILPLGNSSRLVVDLSDRRVYVWRAAKLQASYAVAVGQRGWQTPVGSFQVLKMQKYPLWRHPITGAVVPSGPDNPLGIGWIGFWSDGRLGVGFHGTNQAELVGQAVSHGCLRMHNRDMQALYKQVSVGTPVVVQP